MRYEALALDTALRSPMGYPHNEGESAALSLLSTIRTAD